MRFEKDIVNVCYAPVFVSMHQHACISAHQCASVCISMHQLASVCISMHQYAQVCRSMHQHAYVSMHQHASACVCMHQHASVVYSLYTICIQSVLNLYKICIESVYNTQYVHNMYTIRIQPVYNLYENQHKSWCIRSRFCSNFRFVGRNSGISAAWRSASLQSNSSRSMATLCAESMQSMSRLER